MLGSWRQAGNSGTHHVSRGIFISRDETSRRGYEGRWREIINILIYWGFTIVIQLCALGHSFLGGWHHRLRKANGSTRCFCYTSSNLITLWKITTERFQGHRGLSSMSRSALSHFIRNDTFRSFNYEGKKIRTFSLTSCLSYVESSFREVAQIWQIIIPSCMIFWLKSHFPFAA